MKSRANAELELAVFGVLLSLACSSHDAADSSSHTEQVDASSNEPAELAPGHIVPSGPDPSTGSGETTAPGNPAPGPLTQPVPTPRTGGEGGQASGEVSSGGVSNGGTANAGTANGGTANGGTANAGTSGGTAVGGSPSLPSDPSIRVDGPDLVVSGEPFHIRGVAWNPVPAGQTHPAGLDFAGAAPVDIPLMQAAGFNVVRTYEPLLDNDVLDQLADAGIYVLNSVYPYGGDDPAVVTSRVEQVRSHPALLAWLIGNEWNYNGLYVDLPFDESAARLREVALLVAAADGEHPIATVYGELPDASLIEQMPEIDLWGINSYRGIGFGTLFSDWATRSAKPMFLAEYGADAYNANIDRYDPDSQEQAVVALTREIAMNSRVFGNGPCVGGAVFEWADEWWKDSSGSASEQDVGGIAPGGGPFPDQTFNEEWWGIVDVNRVPRPAYDGLSSLFVELTSAPLR